jgi:peptide/nickel transport system ATP-binding protein
MAAEPLPVETRCFKAQPRCAESEPPLDTVSLGDHRAACFFPLG